MKKTNLSLLIVGFLNCLGSLQAKTDPMIDQLVINGQTTTSENLYQHKMVPNDLPLVEFDRNYAGIPSSVININITLTKEAIEYPVELGISATGNASVDGYQLLSDSVVIESGLSGQVQLELFDNEMLLDGDEITLKLESVKNAAVGVKTLCKIKVINNNVAPILGLKTIQIGENRNIVTKESARPVTINATLYDPNLDDVHLVNWIIEDIQAVDLHLDDDPLTFQFDASIIDADFLDVKLEVEENTIDERLVSHVINRLKLVETLPELVTETDSDEDGMSDFDEGYTDSDGDGILDFLDALSDNRYLPLSYGVIKTEPELHLALGQFALFSSGGLATDAAITQDAISNYIMLDNLSIENDKNFGFHEISPIIDFVVKDLPKAGDVAFIVFPMPNSTLISENSVETSSPILLPEGSVYRNYLTSKGWQTFLEDDLNTIKSAMQNDEGVCPLPNDGVYKNGLNKGYGCIQISIQDGGPNDSDGVANGIIGVSSVLTIANKSPEADIGPNQTAIFGETVVLDASYSSDPEGEDLSYIWQQDTNDSVKVNISGEFDSIASFDAPVVGEDTLLTFRVTVKDKSGGDSIATSQVLILKSNNNPTYVISGNTHVKQGEEVKLSITAQDLDGDELEYNWTQVSGPNVTVLYGTDSPHLNFTSLIEDQSLSEYVFEVRVSDGHIDVVKMISVFVEPNAKESSGGSIGWIFLCLVTILLLFDRKK